MNWKKIFINKKVRIQELTDEQLDKAIKQHKQDEKLFAWCRVGILVCVALMLFSGLTACHNLPSETSTSTMLLLLLASVVPPVSFLGLFAFIFQDISDNDLIYLQVEKRLRETLTEKKQL